MAKVKKRTRSESLSRRQQVNRENIEKGNRGGGGSVFNFRESGEDVKFYDTKKYGKHILTILPYVISSKNHPLVHQKVDGFKIGDEDYMFEYYVHRSIGPAKKSVVCLNKMYGKDCPVCNLRNKYYSEGKDKEAGMLRPQRKVLFNVVNPNDLDSGVQLLDVSYREFYEPFFRESTDTEYDEFSPGDLSDLKDVKFKSFKADYGGNKYAKYDSFSFVDSETAFEDFLDKVFQFDKLLIVPTRDEVEKMLGGDDDEDEEEEDEIEDEDEEVDEDDEEEVDEDDEDEEDEDEEDEDDDPPPPKKKIGK